MGTECLLLMHEISIAKTVDTLPIMWVKLFPSFTKFLALLPGIVHLCSFPSLDSPSFVIYPEIKATDGKFFKS